MELTKLSKLKTNPRNPRTITDAQFERLKDSLLVFPKMLNLRPLATDGNGIVLGGNMRLRALKDIAKMTAEQIAERLQGMKTYNQKSEAEQTALVEYWRNWLTRKDVPTTHESTLTDAEKDEFVMTDNASFGSWDFDAIANEWDAELVDEWGVDVWQDDVSEDMNVSEGNGQEETHGKLTDKFVVPPFSVLDTRQGYWKERKAIWRGLIKDFGESREHTLSTSALMGTINNGVSILDPVMAEIVCSWFGLEGGKAFDCFAGDTVFGYVAATKGMSFTGIELREEQVELNNSRVAGMNAHYICDDGQNVAKHLKKESCDLLFSCPPYFDLEVYSDLPNDASNQNDYNDFLNIIRNAFSGAIRCLKQNRFACIVVGDIRAKDGFYYNFTSDIKDIFAQNGMRLYNECIIIEPLGTLPQRVGRYMQNRKVGKCHQNLLVFYKGDTTKIKDIYPTIDYNMQELEELIMEE
jgi:tRNA1(Val) A37 N6-methylase TrmN6